ncbi:hypothetical protein [Aureimonas sp. N4]|uniref:hypothetical protein n=1 Tax=Aureimonas sp. N4 TaxID=1638165 RepID=UPI0007813518|nr:hypothetical protein [Aureimonas sp. N4]
MRQPLLNRARPGLARNVTIDIPAPFGGINGVDGLAGGAPPTDAIDLVNWMAVEGALETRPGHRIALDLETAKPVGFLEAFDDGDVQSIAASNGKLFRLAGLPLTKTELGTGLGSDRWSFAIMNRRMFLVNGETAPRAVYQGALVTPTFQKKSDETADLDLTKLFRVRAHAKRLFFAQKGSARFWYTAAPGNIQGDLQSFDLSGVGNRGGTIVDIATITPDGAREGDDDAIVFFMSSGDAIMYRGSNPSDAAFWTRVGVFTSARPIASLTYGADVLTASVDGYGELSRLLPSGRSPIAGFGAKLGPLATRSTARFGANEGWQITYDARRRLILVHVPQTPRFCEQHVMNAATGAWTRWTDLPATVWGLIGDALAFGTRDGKIAVMEGANDNGKPIVATGQPTWQQLGAAGRVKKINGVRPIVITRGTPSISTVLAADFRAPAYSAPETIPIPADVGVWDKGVWDKSVWGGAERVTSLRQAGGVSGNYIAAGLRADTITDPLRWVSMSLQAEIGGAA